MDFDENDWQAVIRTLRQFCDENSIPMTVETSRSGNGGQRAMNRIKRLAAFLNPEFYKIQAMRFSTWGTPRIIDCHQEFEQYLQLPRGCQSTLEQIFTDAHVNWQIQDERQAGHPIHVSFKGTLWPMQQEEPAASITKNAYLKKTNEIFERLSFNTGPVTGISYNAVIIDQRILS